MPIPHPIAETAGLFAGYVGILQNFAKLFGQTKFAAITEKKIKKVF
jgi:hypothetical protein